MLLSNALVGAGCSIPVRLVACLRLVLSDALVGLCHIYNFHANISRRRRLKIVATAIQFCDETSNNYNDSYQDNEEYPMDRFSRTLS